MEEDMSRGQRAYFSIAASSFIVLVVAVAPSVQAQEYPAKPVKLITQGAAASGPCQVLHAT
jgi:tripartite-type tricarboxylate transporter receptor subunit TctC